jgi:hypothetical protein
MDMTTAQAPVQGQFTGGQNKRSNARVQFASWLKRAHPEVFARAVKIASESENALASLGETESFWSKFSTAALGLGTTYLALKNQRDAMKINLTRAEQGLDPIDAATSAPVIRTQVDMSPELTQRLVSTAGEGLNKTLLWGGAALIAALFFFRK